MVNRIIRAPGRGAGRNLPQGSLAGFPPGLARRGTPQAVSIQSLKGQGGLVGKGQTGLTLPVLADGSVLANTSGGAAQPVDTTLSALLDHDLGSTEGGVIYRDTSLWKFLGPGSNGQVLTSGGAGAPPSWANAAAGTRSFTRLQRTTTQSIANNTDVPISWNTTAIEDDPGAFAAGSPTQMTTQSGFTRVKFSVYVIFASTGGNLWLWITKNGTEVVRHNWQGVNEGGVSWGVPMLTTATNDVWVCHLFENIGGAITLGNSPRWPLWEAEWLP